MKSPESKTVADLVTDDIRTAHVFKKYGIDFCCGGGVSVKRAAEKARVDYDDLTRDLLYVQNTTIHANNYNNWELDFLVDHITNIHHAYVREKIPVIVQYASKVAEVYGQQHPGLLKIQMLFSEVAIELGGHLNKEEKFLFPFIKEMVKAKKEKTTPEKPQFDTVNNPIRIMEADHNEAGEVFFQIRTLSDNYSPPQGACNTFRAFYAALEEFEQDLHRHVHLENNILFPKTLTLEKELFE